VRAASRTARGRSADGERPGPRWVQCDLTRPETIPPALEGIDVAYYLVHSMGGQDEDPDLGRIGRGHQLVAIEDAGLHGKDCIPAAPARRCRRQRS
jgi:uncharacterized protein YbjT (DUF2867 family)